MRILLVEDHADTAQVMSRLLKLEGHEVETAGSVTAALDLAARGEFDLIISDLGLPDGSGLDLMRQVREKGRPVKGIALSGYGRDEDIRKSRDAGFDEHLIKPVDLRTLGEAIGKVGDVSGR